MISFKRLDHIQICIPSDGSRTYLVDQGIKIKEEIPIPGQNRFTFTDPFGNRIELLQEI